MPTIKTDGKQGKQGKQGEKIRLIFGCFFSPLPPLPPLPLIGFLIVGIVGIVGIFFCSFANADADEKKVEKVEKVEQVEASKPFALEEVLIRGQNTSFSLAGRKTISYEDIKRVPGTGGDVLRALQALPGVAIANDFNGRLHIRGGSPEDNVFYYDRAFLFYPYHFGGLVSTLSSKVIERIDVYAGGFGAEFGSNAQAIIDIKSHDGSQENLVKKLNLSAIMSEALLEGPIGSAGKDGSWYFSARRSYIDLLPLSFERITAIPRFWDYQSKLTYPLNSRHRLTFQAFGSGDRMGFRLGEEDIKLDPELAGNVNFRNGFNSQSFTWDANFSKIKSILTLSHAPYLTDIYIGDHFLHMLPDLYVLREDLSYDLSPRWELKSGIMASNGVVFIKGFFNHPPPEWERELHFSDQPKARVNNKDRHTLIESYLQGNYAPFENIIATLGGRIKYFNRTDQVAFEPRISLNLLTLSELRLRLAFGKYMQSPQPYQITRTLGNPNVSESEATHYTFEIERAVSNNLNAKLAFYYKKLSNLITSNPTYFYLNQGEGFSKGSELFLAYKPSGRFISWLSYANSVSKRKDTPNSPERFYGFDQTQVASLVASYLITPSLEVGAKWHYSTGTPYTPVILGSASRDENGVRQPKFGAGYSKRLPPFHRLDIRLSQSFNFSHLKFQTYVEILNAYNRKNVLAMDYNEDYTQEEPLYQLPIIPYLGVDVEF